MFTFVTSCCSPHICTSQQKSSTECLIWCQSGCVRILPFDRLRGLCHSTVSKSNFIHLEKDSTEVLKLQRSTEVRHFHSQPLSIRHDKALEPKIIHILIEKGILFLLLSFQCVCLKR